MEGLREFALEILCEFIYKFGVKLILINESFLNLRDCYIKDISKIEGLKSLKNLRSLDLSYIEISEISGLDGLINLDELYLDGNQITEIKGLETLNNLRYVSLSENPIRSNIRKKFGYDGQTYMKFCRQKKEKQKN